MLRLLGGIAQLAEHADKTPPRDLGGQSGHRIDFRTRADFNAIEAGFLDMAVTVEIHNTGDADAQRDVVALVEHVLADRPGNWRVSIVGSQENDSWEMQIHGPSGFERSYTLEGTAGEHQPRVIAAIVSKMVPGRS